MTDRRSSLKPLYPRPGTPASAPVPASPPTASAPPPPAAATAEAPAPQRPLVEQLAPLAVLGLGLFLATVAYLGGSAPVALVLLVTFACAAQGLWRGGAEVIGLLAGTLAALVLAPPLGKALEGVIGGLIGSGGLQGRIISVAAVFVVVMLAVTIAASIAARRALRGRDAWRRWNHLAGGGLGLIEGVILGMAVLWVPLALEPIAQARLAAAGELGEPENPAARRLVDFAKAVRESPLGSLARETSPIAGSELLAMAEAYAAVSRDREALTFFLDQPVMKRLSELPSVRSALDRLKADPELREMFSQSSAVSAQTLLAIMQSPLVLDILDHSTIVKDLTPEVDAVAQALKAARAKVPGG